MSSSSKNCMEHLKDQSKALALCGLAFVARLHTAYSGIQGATATTIEVLLTTAHIFAFLSITSTIYICWRSRHAALGDPLVINLPDVFNSASVAFLLTAACAVHYKPVGLGLGAVVAVLFVVTSPAARAFGNALVELCARIRGAFCPPAPETDVESDRTDQPNGRAPSTR